MVHPDIQCKQYIGPLQRVQSSTKGTSTGLPLHPSYMSLQGTLEVSTLVWVCWL